jgi:hypothetical protein
MNSFHAKLNGWNGFKWFKQVFLGFFSTKRFFFILQKGNKVAHIRQLLLVMPQSI